MREDIIYKLKSLQSVEPEKAWVESNKRELMQRMPVFGLKNDIFLNSGNIFTAKSRFSIKSLLPNHFAVSLTSLAVIFTSGILTVGASQSSLPGDTLYPVKKVSEQVALAVASEEDKPRVEIEQAGKRLEELAQISQKTSDVEQHQKVEQLVAEFESKVNSANDRLTQLNDKGKTDEAIKEKVVSVAQVVTEQSEKYSEVLEKTTETMPASVKDKVAESVASAVKTTEKTNMGALMVIVETKKDEQPGEDEKSRVSKKIEKATNRLILVEEEVSVMAVCEEEAEATEEEEVQTEIVETEEEEVQPESEYCVMEEEKVRIEEVVSGAKERLTEAKKKMEEGDLVSSLGILSALSEDIDEYEDGEFVSPEEELIEENQEEQTQEETQKEEGSVQGESDVKENVEESVDIEIESVAQEDESVGTDNEEDGAEEGETEEESEESPFINPVIDDNFASE